MASAAHCAQRSLWSKRRGSAGGGGSRAPATCKAALAACHQCCSCTCHPRLTQCADREVCQSGAAKPRVKPHKSAPLLTGAVSAPYLAQVKVPCGLCTFLYILGTGPSPGPPAHALGLASPRPLLARWLPLPVQMVPSPLSWPPRMRPVAPWPVFARPRGSFASCSVAGRGGWAFWKRQHGLSHRSGAET